MYSSSETWSSRAVAAVAPEGRIGPVEPAVGRPGEGGGDLKLHLFVVLVVEDVRKYELGRGEVAHRPLVERRPDGPPRLAVGLEGSSQSLARSHTQSQRGGALREDGRIH